jgi:hypothetical protein
MAVGPGEEPLDEDRAEPMSPRGVAGVSIVLVLALCWFLVSWRLLGSPLVDALGEAAGGVLAILVVIALGGALVRSRR